MHWLRKPRLNSAVATVAVEMVFSLSRVASLSLVMELSSSFSGPVSRTRCGILHAAAQSRDRSDRCASLRPRLCSAPLREELRAALRPGHELINRRFANRRAEAGFEEV